MKRQLLLITMILISGTIFAQSAPAAKKDTVPAAVKTPAVAQPVAPATKQYFIVLPADNWQYLFSIIRSSGKLTAVQAEDYIEAFNKMLKELPVPEGKKKE